MSSISLCVALPVAGVAVAVVVGLWRYAARAGLFDPVKVGVVKKPLGELTIMYKPGTGSYHNVGPLFGEMCRIAPDKDMIGLYYDDPTVIPEKDLRWAVGTILAEADEMIDGDTEQALAKAGYKQFRLPSADNVVQCKTVAVNNWLSLRNMLWRVYPAVAKFLTEKKLADGPWVEVYQENMASVMCPLDHHTEFYVPEVTYKPK